MFLCTIKKHVNDFKFLKYTFCLRDTYCSYWLPFLVEANVESANLAEYPEVTFRYGLERQKTWNMTSETWRKKHNTKNVMSF